MPETAPHPTGRGFPSTRHSLLAEARSGDAAAREVALDALGRLYWRPVYKYLRVRWSASAADAEDLTQEFFADALRRDLFASYDPAKARFRTFLRVCLDRLASNSRRSASAAKRGGQARTLSLGFDVAEAELERCGAHAAADPDDYFRREWVRSLFALAVDDLRERCRETGREAHFAVFERYDVEGADGARPTYQAVADECAITVAQVTNHLASARREFRRLVLERLREASASDEDFRTEARELLGVDPA
jgi:RNA polymerase sigma factor (sigma-70 family)